MIQGKKNAGDGGVQKGGDEADEQGAQAEAGKVVSAIWSDGADAAELDADGGEIRKTGEREGSESVGAVGHEIRRLFPAFHEEIRVVFVDGKLGAEQAGDGMDVFHINAH